MRGVCPECEFSFTAPDIEVGETLVCRECKLTLQVTGVDNETLALEPVEAFLTDWGE
jgi:lysine biosynthesis protein LysW